MPIFPPKLEPLDGKCNENDDNNNNKDTHVPGISAPYSMAQQQQNSGKRDTYDRRDSLVSASSSSSSSSSPAVNNNKSKSSNNNKPESKQQSPKNETRHDDECAVDHQQSSQQQSHATRIPVLKHKLTSLQNKTRHCYYFIPIRVGCAIFILALSVVAVAVVAHYLLDRNVQEHLETRAVRRYLRVVGGEVVALLREHHVWAETAVMLLSQENTTTTTETRLGLLNLTTTVQQQNRSSTEVGIMKKAATGTLLYRLPGPAPLLFYFDEVSLLNALRQRVDLWQNQQQALCALNNFLRIVCTIGGGEKGVNVAVGAEQQAGMEDAITVNVPGTILAGNVTTSVQVSTAQQAQLATSCLLGEGSTSSVSLFSWLNIVVSAVVLMFFAILIRQLRRALHRTLEKLEQNMYNTKTTFPQSQEGKTKKEWYNLFRELHALELTCTVMCSMLNLYKTYLPEGVLAASTGSVSSGDDMNDISLPEVLTTPELRRLTANSPTSAKSSVVSIGTFMNEARLHARKNSSNTNDLRFTNALKSRHITAVVVYLPDMPVLAGESTDTASTISVAVSNIVLGVVDRFEGVVLQMSSERVVATWNGHRSCVGHERQACRAAMEIASGLRAAALPEAAIDDFAEFGAFGGSSCSMSKPRPVLEGVRWLIAVGTGECGVGSTGALYKKTSVTVGPVMVFLDHIAREAKAREYAYHVLVNARCVAELRQTSSSSSSTSSHDGFNFRGVDVMCDAYNDFEVGPAQVTGEPVFELLPPSSQYTASELRQFDEAFACFLEGNYEHAGAAFLEFMETTRSVDRHALRLWKLCQVPFGKRSWDGPYVRRHIGWTDWGESARGAALPWDVAALATSPNTTASSFLNSTASSMRKGRRATLSEVDKCLLDATRTLSGITPKAVSVDANFELDVAEKNSDGSDLENDDDDDGGDVLNNIVRCTTSPETTPSEDTCRCDGALLGEVPQRQAQFESTFRSGVLPPIDNDNTFVDGNNMRWRRSNRELGVGAFGTVYMG
eukprot:PhM_4_TR3087/c1_g2_i1/m.53873